MEKDITITRRQAKIAVILLVIVILVALIFSVIQKATEDRRIKEEIATSEGIVRVLSSIFKGRRDLRVGEQTGALDVTTVNQGKIFRSEIKIVVPYSVDYFVDLTAVNISNFKWDETSKTLIVSLADVKTGKPNIDEGAIKVINEDGIWISRDASRNHVRRAAVLATRGAKTEAERPENLARARRNARDALSSILKPPLQIAGLGEVRLVVRFPQDGEQNAERWDVSPSIAEVLARNREKASVR